MAAKPLSRQLHCIVSVIGTRPEAIKMRPVLRALSALPFIEQEILLTGQHQGLASSFEGFSVTELPLDLTEQSVGEICDTVRDAVGTRLTRAMPDLVLVQGDTTSALAAALAARDCGLAIAHVEAGLRSHEPEPWPEESNRVTIDSIADLLFAPTAAAAHNLAREPAVWGKVHVTGNSGIDALLENISSTPTTVPTGRRRIIVTSHRRENQAEQLRDICAALRRLVTELPVEIRFLLHSNPARRAFIEGELLGVDHIQLSDHVGHAEMIDLMLQSWLVLTDSGGLQEDGPGVGKPVLVMRKVTERIEAPANIQLVGTTPDAIFNAVNRLLMSETCYARMATPVLPFGDGHAGPRIAAIIADWLVNREREPGFTNQFCQG